MSTNRTPNLGLNQWQRDEEVIMDDFNADNAKIDAAVTEVRAELAEVAAELLEMHQAIAEASPWVKLFERVIETPVTAVPIDLSGVDLTHFYQLNICVAANYEDTTVCFRVNDLTSGYLSQGSGGWYEFNSFFSSNGSYARIDIKSNQLYVYGETTVARMENSVLRPVNLKKITAVRSSSTAFPVGSRIALFGLRA